MVSSEFWNNTGTYCSYTFGGENSALCKLTLLERASPVSNKV